jgi:hypothetical protein
MNTPFSHRRNAGVIIFGGVKWVGCVFKIGENQSMVAAARNYFLCNIFLTREFTRCFSKILPTFIHFFKSPVIAADKKPLMIFEK